LINDGLKKLGLRVEFWLVLIIFGVLGDEVIKEGYIFNFSEIFNGEFTHEKIVVGLICTLICLIIGRRIKKQDNLIKE